MPLYWPRCLLGPLIELLLVADAQELLAVSTAGAATLLEPIVTDLAESSIGTPAVPATLLHLVEGHVWVAQAAVLQLLNAQQQQRQEKKSDSSA